MCAAPIGNKYALGNNGGCPPIYNTLAEMLPILQEWEQEIKEGAKPTVTGLALALGFCDKKSVYDYAKKDEFLHPIKRALLIVENGYESALRENNATGSIFALKNMGWIDKTHSDITTNDKDINPTLSPESISKLIDKL
jgi:hypothetical protein